MKAETQSMGWLDLTCGHCRATADLETWKQTPVFGELPEREFQCPKCGRAFRRELKALEGLPAAVPILIPIESRM